MELAGEASTIIATAGGVSGLGGLVGAMIGNRVDLGWIKRELAELKATVKGHGARLNGHDIQLAVLERGKQE